MAGANARAKTTVDMQTQLEEARLHLAKKDKALARVIKQVGQCRLTVDPMQSAFDALTRAIMYQQLTGKAAATILGRVKALGRLEGVFDHDDVLFLTEEQLRAAGCSRAKALALKDLALKVKEGHVPHVDEMHAMTDEELIERLCAVRGIGKWSVEMLMMFRLGRLDILPATDYGVRKGFAITYKLDDLPTPKEILAHGELWRPYRSVASWYMWRANEL
ncbi:MAG TPA: DNA-3-methyladenine glycosylase 2 family protein [Planktothrix sp.]|jgi:DNA-3-methyladenine glycosylase II